MFALAFQTGPLSLCSNTNSIWFFQTTRVLLRSILFNVADINTQWVAVKGGRSYTRGISQLPLADNIASLKWSGVRTSFEIGAFHLPHVSCCQPFIQLDYLSFRGEDSSQDLKLCKPIKLAILVWTEATARVEKSWCFSNSFAFVVCFSS